MQIPQSHHDSTKQLYQVNPVPLISQQSSSVEKSSRGSTLNISSASASTSSSSILSQEKIVASTNETKEGRKRKPAPTSIPQISADVDSPAPLLSSAMMVKQKGSHSESTRKRNLEQPIPIESGISASDTVKPSGSKRIKKSPISILYSFKKAFNFVAKIYDKISRPCEHSLYVELYKLHLVNAHLYDYSIRHPDLTTFEIPPEGFPIAVHISGKLAGTGSYEYMSSEQMENERKYLVYTRQQIVISQKKRKNCDEILAEYLDTVAKEVSKKEYRDILKFVLLFREYLKTHGKSSSENNKEPEEAKEDYCRNNNMENSPDLINGFMIMISKKEIKFGYEKKYLAKKLCEWLHENTYTIIRLFSHNR